MEEKLNLIPTCFQKGVINFSKHFKENSKCSNINYREIPTTLPAKDIFTILKNLELTLSKALHLENINKKINIKSATKLFKISKNSDIYNFKLSESYLKLFHYESSFKLIRFYSYSIANNSYFFLFKLVDEKDETKNLCKGGIIIPEKEKKILIFIHRKKNTNLNNKTLDQKSESYLKLFIENFNIITSAVSNSFSKEDYERLSTVETFECEEEFYESNLSHDFKEYPLMDHPGEEDSEVYEDFPNEILLDNKRENIEEDSSSEFEEVNEPETIDLDEEMNFELIDTTPYSTANHSSHFIDINPEKEIPHISSCIESNYVRDEFDPEYRKVRKLTKQELIDLNLYDNFIELKEELKKIDKDNFSDNELTRFIYGWKGQVENIKYNLIELESWRNNYKPEFLTLNDFQSENFNFPDLISIPCQDIYGRPIILIKAKNLDHIKINVESFVKFLVFTIESAIKMMPENIDKLIIVIDIKDAGLNNFSMVHLNKIREVTARYYVERLSNIVVINRGFFFGILWKVISKFLDERILRKLIVLDDSKRNWFLGILGGNLEKIQIV